MPPRLLQPSILAIALALIIVGAGLGLAGAPPIARASALRSLGTPTAPPTPTDEPPATATAQPTATIMPTALPTASPPPTATVRPNATPRPRDPQPTAAPPATATAAPPATTEIELLKQVDRGEAAAGELLVYTITVRNMGASPATDLVVSDMLPAELEAVDLSSTRGAIVVEGQAVLAYPRELAAGELAEIRITARLRPGITASEVANTAQVTTSTAGDAPENNSSTAIVRVITRSIQRLPRTAAPPDRSLLARVPPLAWAALVGGLLFTLGGSLRWGLRGRQIQPHQGARGVAPTAPTQAFRLPSMPPAGPPQLGPALPPPAPPTPLPPLVHLDRAAALRDRIDDDLTGEL